MRYQSNRAACGPAALHNALQALGVTRTEDELIKLTGQNADGTPPKGLLRAISTISSGDTPLMGEAIRWPKAAEAIVGLWYWITSRGRPVILCVDSFEHWVTCVGHLGTRFAVVDSAETGLLFYYTGEELASRWEGPKGGFHGIVV